MERPTSLRDRIAQLCFIRFGSNIRPKIEATDDLDRVSQIVQQHPIGGLLLFNGGTAELAAATLAEIQARSTIPLTITADMERGLAQQVTDLTTWPHALAFDALGADAAEEVEQFAKLSATEARSIGVHLSFSPVADIHRNPNNPIIANRAFATTPERTAELAASYVRGCHAAGLLCCAKHFPGHGNTHEDSHAKLPFVEDSFEQLEQTDLYPFRALADMGVDMFMTAHVAYPALDSTGTPATLSSPILTDILRNQWNFDGAVVSDSLKMDGVKASGASEGELAVQAIAAGVDLLLDVDDVAGVIDAIESAANSDANVSARVEAAFEQAWKVKLKAFNGPTSGQPDEKTSHQHALRIATGSCRVLANDGRISLPITPEHNVGFLLVNPLGDNAYTKTNRIVETFESFSHTKFVHVFGPEASESAASDALTSFSSCDACIVALVVKPAAWCESSIPAWQHELLLRLCREKPTVMVAMGIAELLDDYSNAALKVATFSDAPVCQEALAKLVMSVSGTNLRSRHDST